MLHTGKEHPRLDSTDSSRLAKCFTEFFDNKLKKISADIAQRLTYAQSPFIPFAGNMATLYHQFSPVTKDEVSRLLKVLPDRSLPLNVIPNSLLKSCSGILTILHTSVLAVALSRAACWQWHCQAQGWPTYLSNRVSFPRHSS